MKTIFKQSNLYFSALSVLILTGCAKKPVETQFDSSSKIELTQIGRVIASTNKDYWNKSAAEIVSYDNINKNLFVTNSKDKTVDIINISNPKSPIKKGSLDLSVQKGFGGVNSCASKNGLIAVAVENENKQANGWVMFFNATNFAFIKSVKAGALPDMVTFTPDGNKVIVANEGEPSNDYSVDPEGSVSIVDMKNYSVKQVAFKDFNIGGTRNAELPKSVRVFGNYGHSSTNVVSVDGKTLVLASQISGIKKNDWITIQGDKNLEDAEPVSYQIAELANNSIILTDKLDDEATFGKKSLAKNIVVHFHNGQSSVAQDLEPEYVAVSKDNKKAFVSLQENNAIAVIDIKTGRIDNILGLGTKNHRLKGNELDVSDKDKKVNIKNWDVDGMYMPDTIATYAIDGNNYIVTANEGDGRAYDGYCEEIRFYDAEIGFKSNNDFKDKKGVGRLLTTLTNDTDNDGTLDKSNCFGARSFSIFDDKGNLMFDSGSDFGKLTAKKYGKNFNNHNKKNKADDRSDSKGCEPEALALGQIGNAIYAFIGLERMGGVMVYNISNPKKPIFIQYINNRNVNVKAKKFGDITGDYGPEGMTFISKKDSPNGKPLLVVANEVSGSTTIYEIDL